MRAERRVSVTQGKFYISTIDQLNEKIGSLSVSLEHFSQNASGLVVDGNSEDRFHFERIDHGNFADEEVEEQFGFGKEQSDVINKVDTHSTLKAENSKEMDKFAGVYSFKVVLSSGAEADSKNTSTRSFKKRLQEKIGMSESHQSLNKRPMLVELHSFPGFDRDETTALPFPLQAMDILKTVTEAQMDLGRKPSFKRYFSRFLLSKISQAILQDTFWWFFCHKFQPTPRAQESLFNRIAHNYTKLMVTWIGSRYQDTIFKRYPDLVSQAVYATFCHAFPTSYRQFDDKFKDELIFLVYQWIVGTKPSPRIFDIWNSVKLEPSGMRKGEQMHTASQSTATKPALDLQLSEENLGPVKKTSHQRPGPLSQGRRISRAMGPVAKKPNFLLPSICVSSSKDSVSEPRDKQGATGAVSSEFVIASAQFQDGGAIYPTSLAKRVPAVKKPKESCKAGKGPEFSKNVFDIYGRSPLVKQFLLANHLAKNAGIATLVRRTEISELPCASNPTYQDIIKESLSLARRLETQFHSTLEENAAERYKFVKKQRELQRDFTRRTAQLMSNPKEVKRISDLLRLELLRDQNDDSQNWSAQVAAELDRAMGYDVSE